jgi:uncharacterized protein
MESCDTNILLHAYNLSSPHYKKAFKYLETHADKSDFVICELILIELYVLLRNPAVVKNPLPSEHAVAVCNQYRNNPIWKIVDYPGNLMDKIWTIAAKHEFPRRSIFDAKIALTLTYHGVDVFATRNTKHFSSFGFREVWNPLE